jgi:hypothetical protein
LYKTLLGLHIWYVNCASVLELAQMIWCGLWKECLLPKLIVYLFKRWWRSRRSGENSDLQGRAKDVDQDRKEAGAPPAYCEVVQQETPPSYSPPRSTSDQEHNVHEEEEAQVATSSFATVNEKQ